MLDAKIIPIINADNKYATLGRAADGDTFYVSASGKAIRLTYGPLGQRSLWFPVSILRRVESGIYGASLLVPKWFLAKNGVLFETFS